MNWTQFTLRSQCCMTLNWSVVCWTAMCCLALRHHLLAYTTFPCVVLVLRCIVFRRLMLRCYFFVLYYITLRYVAACCVVLWYVAKLCCFRSVVQYFPLRYLCSTVSVAVYWCSLDWVLLLPDNELDVFTERYNYWEWNCNWDVNVRVKCYGNVDGVINCLMLFPVIIFCWYYDYVTLGMENR
jgi:hypothetical protein